MLRILSKDGIDNSVATEPPPPPPGYITSTTSVLNTNEKLNKVCSNNTRVLHR